MARMAVREVCEVEQSLPRFDVEVKNTFVHFGSAPARKRSTSSPPKADMKEPATAAAPAQHPEQSMDVMVPGLQELDGCNAEPTGSDTASTSAYTGDRSPRSDEASEDDAQGVTTLMLRNIPCRCREEEVVEAIADLGFADLAQFFYMPVKSLHKKNLGYAFIGFPDVQTAETFRQSVDGRNIFKNRQSSKSISVVPAHVQGLDETLQRFSGCSKGPKLLPNAMTCLSAQG